MRLVFVGFAESVHTARHLELLTGSGWEVHLFPSKAPPGLHPDVREAVVHLPPDVAAAGTAAEGVRVEPLGESDVERDLDEVGHVRRATLARALARLVDELEPDLVHTQELQHAGYLMLDARAHLARPAPPWLVLNCGSDIYLHGRRPEHAARIRAVLAACDWYVAECHRDVALARAFGLRAPVLPVLPVAGGFDLDDADALRTPGPTSSRRTIALKGYPRPVGRSDVLHEALRRCGDALAGYIVQPYLHYAAGGALREELDAVCAQVGAQVGSLGDGDAAGVSHPEVLALHGRARVSVGLNVSDGISQSFLEAMAMGSFPVQSHAACASEWARDGVGALLVDPEDPDAVTAALRRALTDDDLVDRAAAVNRATARAHLDRRVMRARVLDAYERVVADRAARVAA